MTGVSLPTILGIVSPNVVKSDSGAANMSDAKEPGKDQGDKRGCKRKAVPDGLIFAWVCTILVGYHLVVVCDFGHSGPAALDRRSR